VTAERALLAALEGGCQVPIGALARADEDGALVLHALVASIDGTAILRGERRVEGTGLEEVGRALAAELLACGGATILAAARAAGEVPRPQPE
jgi:hydroxymethylbilane synthase